MATTVRKTVAPRPTVTTKGVTVSKKTITIKADKMERIATVPDKKYLDEYIPRKIGELTEFEIFDAAYKLKHNVLIEGPTGTGKTSSILAYAVHKGLPFYSVSSSNGTEPTQLFGKYIPSTSGGFTWQDGPVTDLVRHGGILLINEVNFIPDRVKTVLFGLLDKRRKIELVDHQSEVIFAPDNFIVFADMNPDYEGTRPLNKAFRNRFATQLHFDYDIAVEAKLVTSKSLKDLAAQIRVQITEGLYDTPVSTNMLIEFEEIAKELSVAFAMSNFINHFQFDDRASIRQVFDTWESNIISDYSSHVKVKDTTVDNDNEPEGEFYTDSELDSMSLQEIKNECDQLDISKREINKMDLEELRGLLSGNHPYWNEDETEDENSEWVWEEGKNV